MSIPEDILKTAESAASEIVGHMCVTYRHDFGLLPEDEREGLRRTMAQIAYHEVRPAIARALMAERERAAQIVSASLREGSPIDPSSVKWIVGIRNAIRNA